MGFIRSPTAALLLLVLAGLAILTVAPVQSQQQGGRRPTPPPPKCTLSADELDALITQVEDIEREPSEGNNDDDEDSEETEPESAATAPQLNPGCARELRRLRHSIDHLQKSYHNLKQNTVDIDEQQYRYMQNHYTARKRELNAQLELLSQRSNAQHRSQLMELKRKIAAMEKQLNRSVTQLAEERQQNMARRLQLVALNVRNNKIPAALSNFEKLANYTSEPYGAIVQNVFQTGSSSTNAWALLSFLRKVDLSREPIAGYETLVDALIARNALRGPEALELLKQLQCLILVRDGQQQARTIALLKKFKANVH
ncbi:uncharacterized protein LOC133393034 [Anopheles gambiae]|uniref:uncharacterized protein LOC133393034 n=1 Tax=Anopheles gambiae TaxID=7165 RepID=UPI002AC92BD1|nr:uncharacterized protein LOC133393034 [Anopheles gambiae]